MKCLKCQTENPETRKFCRECGVTLSHTCHQCGNENWLGDKFCGECGYALVEPIAAPPIDYTQPQSYTPKFLADKILDTRGFIEGERKLVTVLFADVANYTSISEKLDPEKVYQIMDGCLKALMDEIHKYEGTIDKFTGDGVMAIFGAPVAHEDHAQRACYAALATQNAIKRYRGAVKKEFGIDFKMRVGLNSGPVVVGAVGNDLRMDYTAIGDTTNLASRMESMARPGTVLVSADTHEIAKDFFMFEPMGKVRVKGKAKPVEAYELVEASKVETRFEAAIAKGLTKFVGRNKEIAVLKEAFDKARSGSGQVIGMVGEAGVGKSRILLEFRGMLPQEKYTYMEGHCLHYGGSMPYMPLLDILRSCFDIQEGERESAIKKKMAEKINQLGDELKVILPPLHDVLSLKVDDKEYLNLEPPQKRGRTFEAIRDLLIRESEGKPLIIAIEDLHWIDRTSEEFLTYIIGWLANTRILLALLYRPEYTHQWGSKSYYSQIGVDQLSTSTSAELVQYILEGGEVAPNLMELILTRAAGNPLFVEEFTHTLLENGSIERRIDQYMLSTKTSDIKVPDTIQGIITARMDRLEENLKRTMQVASVIGRDFAFRILHAITGRLEELKSYLIDLQGLEFIYEKSLFPELEYIFKHALTQEVAYNSLLLRRRKEIHEKIGKAIEELYPDRLEEFYEMLAHHYSKSENPEKAYQYSKLAGEKAALRYSTWEAFRYYKEAIKVLNKLPKTEENIIKGIEVRLLVATPMQGLAYPEDSLQVLQEGERLASELGDERSLAKFSSSISFCHSVRGEALLGREYAENGFRAAEKIEDIELMAPLAFDLCFSYNTTGEYYKITEMTPKVMALLEKTGRESEFFGTGVNLYSVLLANCAQATARLGNYKEGLALCEKALRFQRNIDDLYGIGFIEFSYGYVFIQKGDGKGAIEHFKKAMRHFEDGQMLLFLPLCWSGLGWGYYLLGELETARKNIEKGLKMQHDSGTSFVLSFHYYILGLTHLDLGDLKEARICIEEALRLAENNNEKQFEGRSRILLGRVLGKADTSQSGAAEELILQGIRILDDLKLRPHACQGYLYLGELCANTGQRKKALEYLEKAESTFREMGTDYWLRRTQEVMEMVKG